MEWFAPALEDAMKYFQTKAEFGDKTERQDLYIWTEYGGFWLFNTKCEFQKAKECRVL